MVGKVLFVSEKGSMATFSPENPHRRLRRNESVHPLSVMTSDTQTARSDVIKAEDSSWDTQVVVLRRLSLELKMGPK